MEVIGIVAISLDGCITRHEDEGVAFTSEADKRYYHQALEGFDCSVFGSTTFQVAKESILQALYADRLRIVWTREPEQYRVYERAGKLEFKAGELRDIVHALQARGKRRCAILGGTYVYTESIRQGLVDALWVTVEPLGFGSGKRLFEGQVDFEFSLQSVEHLSADTLLLKYRVLSLI